MLHMIPALLEANLNGSLSRLKAYCSIDCRNATIIKVCHIVAFFFFKLNLSFRIYYLEATSPQCVLLRFKILLNAHIMKSP